MGVTAVAVGDVAIVAFFGKLRRGAVAAGGTGHGAALRHELARRGVATRARRAHAGPGTRSEGWVDDPRTCGLGGRARVSCVAAARRAQGSAHGDPLAPDHEVVAG